LCNQLLTQFNEAAFILLSFFDRPKKEAGPTEKKTRSCTLANFNRPPALHLSKKPLTHWSGAAMKRMEKLLFLDSKKASSCYTVFLIFPNSGIA